MNIFKRSTDKPSSLPEPVSGKICGEWVEMLTLLLLQERDMYGFEITQLCRERSGGRIRILEGSIYPVLYRLEEEGSIKGYEKEIMTKRGVLRKRTLYTLLPAGRERLVELKKRFDETVEGINRIRAASTLIE